MKYASIVLLIAAIGALWVACTARTTAADASATQPFTPPAAGAHTKTAIFAAGCFWGVQERFDKLPGVISTEAGYTGGHVADPSYELVCTHTTGHAESVEVTYDPAKISYAELLDAFWTMHDPTTIDQQGPDIGDSYRSAIFFVDAEQEKIAKASLAEVQAAHIFHDKIVTQIVPATKFYKAEEYHQHYFENNGGTCHNGIATVHTKLAAEAKHERELAAAGKQDATK
jgi:peptide-methionine (S)-S-oxide reductase